MIYNSNFFNSINQVTTKDAEIILPFIIKQIKPKNVVDFGCGEGLWLSIIKKTDKNISILGLDGEYINKERLKIPVSSFSTTDLSQPLALNSKFDLAISTEVAEHIDPQNSDTFINNITNSADHILFSAAIPGQGGVYHINEQWQSYWIEKFAERGYYVDYSIRNYFWDNNELSEYRRQNLLFFSKTKTEPIAPIKPLTDVVHPESYIKKTSKLQDITHQLYYLIKNPETYNQLDAVLAEIVNTYKNIVIYPYGNNGKLCKAILNIKYETEEYAIVDNIQANSIPEILAAKDLRNIKDEYIVIDTCSNTRIHQSLLDELHKYVASDHIFSVFKKAP